MMNLMIAGIRNSLGETFGDGYEIVTEEKALDQGSPCFFIACADPSVERASCNRYLRQNPFRIQYYPRSESIREECLTVAEKMIWCLEEITVDGSLMRGTGIKYEVTEGVLNFFVGYNCYVQREKQYTPMESIEAEQNVKG